MMSLEQFVIVVYCMVDDLYGAVVGNVRLRARGPAPGLSDVDVIVMEIVGEFLGYHHDEKLWVYFSRHWKALRHPLKFHRRFRGKGCARSAAPETFS